MTQTGEKGKQNSSCHCPVQIDGFTCKDTHKQNNLHYPFTKPCCKAKVTQELLQALHANIATISHDKVDTVTY